MKLRFFLVLLFTVALLHSAYAAPRFRADAPFSRVFVMTGGGPQTAMFLGMLEGLEIAGWKPDLIVGTCGGGMGAAVAQAFPDPVERKNFLESKEFFDALRTTEIRDSSVLNWIDFPGKVNEWLQNGLMPDLLTPPILHVPQSWHLEVLSQKFNLLGSGDSERYRIVVFAAEFLGNPALEANQQIGNRKLFRQIVLTDDLTAAILQESLKAPIAEAFPKSYIDTELQIETDWNYGEPIRASIAEPFLMEPFERNSKSYLAGSIDLYPIEWILPLSKKLTMLFPDEFGDLEIKSFKSVFGYDMHERIRMLTSSGVNYWIDETEYFDLVKHGSFTPSVHSPYLKIEDNIPKTHKEYVEKVRYQWNWGKKRALEVFEFREYDVTHIRKMTATTAKPELLKFWKMMQKLKH